MTISFGSNAAAGYGADVATAPSELIIIDQQGELRYVPGQSIIDVTLQLVDSQGQVVVGSEHAGISHMLQLLVLPSKADCSTFASCELQKLQAKFLKSQIA